MQISITLIIIIFTSLISFQGFNRYDVIDKLKHSPYKEENRKEFYRLLTSGFVHADWIHLLINMFVLYMFGTTVETYLISLFGNPMGKIFFLLLYILTIILANTPTFLQHKNNPSFSSIGASGAVSGIVFIYILLQPWKMIYMFFVIPMPAVIAGIGYLIYSSWAANQERGRVDHSAHFTGAIAGMLIMFVLHRQIASDFLNRLVRDFPF